jgi:D-alanyl-D-alanine carboxypeptidase/D-alanyl-D-alanine-endopeptidase (penicillin-binding protein 4)
MIGALTRGRPGRGASRGDRKQRGTLGAPARRGVHLLACLAFTATAFAQNNTGTSTPLPAPVKRVLAAYGLSEAGLSVFVQALDSSEPLLEFNADVPRNPASTQKLLTTFAALELLGPAHTWRTDVYALGNRTGDRLEGDLLVKGYGDPDLTTERVWLLMRGLMRRGIKHVTGDLVLDDSYYALEPDDPGTFDGQRYRTYNALPYALLTNFQAVDFIFRADSANNRVVIRTDPALPNLRIDNGLKLVPGACRGTLDIAMHATSTAAEQLVSFSGAMPDSCGEYYFSRTIMDPPSFSYGVIRGVWEEMGGEIDGGMRRGTVPAGAHPINSIESQPLVEIVRTINKFSNNVMARQLLIAIGAERYGAPGTQEKGIAAVREWLTKRGLEMPELVLENGAGLSRETRISARSMARMLIAAHASPYEAELIASMPLSAMDGTLRRRFTDAGMAGRLHLKTGRLEGVSGLAGYVLAPNGRRYVLVSLHNDRGVQLGAGSAVQNALMRWLFAQ